MEYSLYKRKNKYLKLIGDLNEELEPISKHSSKAGEFFEFFGGKDL